MIDSEVLAVSNINQAIIASPAVVINDALWFYFTADNGLQRGFRIIRNYLGVDLPVTFENTEDDGFAISTTASFSFDTTCPKERLINFNFSGKRRLLLAKFGKTNTDGFKKSVGCVAIQAGQFIDLECPPY